MLKTGTVNHFNIARFEASSKYVILKWHLIETLLHEYLKFANV